MSHPGAPPPADSPRHREPAFNVPPATLVICLALVAVYGLFRLSGAETQQWILETFAFIPGWFLAQFGPASEGVSPTGLWPLVTHAFLHIDLTHLVLNAGFLLAFGTLVERRFGTPGFLVIFCVAAAAGALLQAAVKGPTGSIMIGASGAVYGMLGAAVLLMFTGNLSRRFRSALAFVAVIMGINVVVGLISSGGAFFGYEIAWQAHIGGFVAGLLLALLLARVRSRRP